MADTPKIKMTSHTSAKKAAKRERVRVAMFNVMKAVEPENAPESISELDAEDLAALDEIASAAVELWDALSS